MLFRLKSKSVCTVVSAIPLLGMLLAFQSTDKPLNQFELAAESPRFWNLIDRDAKLTKVAGDFGFTEGPVWDRSGFLYVSDETQNKIYRVYPDGRKEAVISLGDPDGNTFDTQATACGLRERIARNHSSHSRRAIHNACGPFRGPAFQ